VRIVVRTATIAVLAIVILQTLTGLSVGAIPGGQEAHGSLPQAAPTSALDAYPGPDPTNTPSAPNPTSTPDGGYPVSTKTPTPTSMPTSTPTSTPTPVAISLREVRPREGRDDVVTRLEILGANFPVDAQAWLAGDGLGDTNLRTIFLDNGHLTAKVPPGLTPGLYDLSVSADDQSDVLAQAYRVLNAALLDDLRADPFRLWTSPLAPREGVTITLGLVVDRLGGTSSLTLVPVRFSVGETPGSTVLGNAIIPAIGVNDRQSTTAVEWGAPPAGSYTIWAEIDPADAIFETNETNNVISRTLTVREQKDDSTPPTIESLRINDGSGVTDSRPITLTLQASDNPGGSGMARAFYTELHWNAGAQSWVPVQWTSWLPYGRDHHWTLHPESGMRYIQAWASDRVGNVSASPAKAKINYVPSSETLVQGEIRAYRIQITAGQCVTVEVVPISGDPDLYVWPPSFQPGGGYWYSLNGEGEIDRIHFAAAESGEYQIEVEGYSDTTYRLSIMVSDECDEEPSPPTVPAPTRGLSAHRMNGLLAKSPRDEPAVDGDPPDQLSIPELPAASYPSYLPLISKNYESGGAGMSLYLPIILKRG